MPPDDRRSPRLETGRLLLRPFREDDVDELFEILGDAETMRFYPAPFTREETETWIRNNLDRYERDGFALWAIEDRPTRELLGDCGLVRTTWLDDIDEVEVGWHVKRSRWGQGIATEAGAAWRDHAFGELGLERIISLIRPENIQSRRVAEKIGMSVEKETAFGPQGWRHFVYAVRRWPA